MIPQKLEKHINQEGLEIIFLVYREDEEQGISAPLKGSVDHQNVMDLTDIKEEGQNSFVPILGWSNEKYICQFFKKVVL